jgi:putative membrane protein
VRNNNSLAEALVTGLVSGLVATWTMNQYWEVQSKLQQQMQPSHKEEMQNRKEQREEDNPTVKVAEAIARPLLHRELTPDEKKTAGETVHYGFGALMGGIYGVLSEVQPAVTAGFGTAFAVTLWLVVDEGMVPLLKLSGPPQEYPLSQHLKGLGAHLVYGWTTEAVRRAVTTE